MKETISNYKLSNRTVGMNCHKMSEMLLVRVDSKRVYEADNFLAEQKNHCRKVLGQLMTLYNEIIDTMNATYEVSRSTCRFEELLPVKILMGA